MKDVEYTDILRIKDNRISREEDMVIVEYPFTIFMNDRELITLLCSPNSLEYLALGFLLSEGFIDSYSDVKGIRMDEDAGIAYVYTSKTDEFNDHFRGRRTITSGCGKGTVFYNVLDSLRSKRVSKPISIDIEGVRKLVGMFGKRSELFLNTGGAHSCALCDNDSILIFEEDIGRHNALDKVFGRALFSGLDTGDKIILSSGRISSEMLIKAAKRGVPVVISRSAPTSLAIKIAERLDISLIGFARGQKMNVYSNFMVFDS